MPQIPQYVSKEQMTTQVGGYRQDASQAAKSGPGAVIQQAGEQLTALGEKMRKIGNANATSNAKLDKMRFEVKDADDRAKDPKYDTGYAEVRKSRQTIANKHFSDPIGKAEWLRKQEIDDEVYIINQRAAGYARQVSERKVQVFRDLELEEGDWVFASDEVARKDVEDRMEEIANNPANVDIFNAEQRKRLVDDSIRSAENTLADVKKLTRVQEAEARKAASLAKNARENEYVGMRRTHKDKNGADISDASLIKMINDDPLVSEKFKEPYIKSITNPKMVKAETNPKKFDKILTDMLKGGVSRQEETRLDMVLEASKPDPGLSWEDYDFLNEFNEAINNPETMDKFLPQKGFWGTTEAWREENAAGAITARLDMFRSYLSKTNNGMEPKQASQEVIAEEILKLHPAAATYPKEGKKVMDMWGVMKLIVPILQILDINEKSTTGKK